MIAFGIAGTGRMAARMVGAMRASGEAKVARVASASTDRAEAFAAQHGMTAHGDLAAMIADPSIEAVYVAGRNRDHAQISCAALAAGKAVLCEKPFACSRDEADAVLAAARQAGRLFMEAVATPFLPAVAEAITVAQGGARGKPWYVEASFGYPVDAGAEPGLFAADAGLLLDRAVYPVTLARLILGAVRQQRIEKQGETIWLYLDHVGGGRSDLAVSFTERLANRLLIDCDTACVSVPAPLLTAQLVSTRPAASDRGLQLRQNPILRRAGEVAARLRGEWRSYGASPYLPELKHFCALLREGQTESPVLTHDVMRDVQRIIADPGASA